MKRKAVNMAAFLFRTSMVKAMNKKIFRKFDGLKYGWLKDTKAFLLLLFIVFIFFRFVIGFSFVKGDSMESTLHNNEIVMYTRINPEYKRGDVVSVRILSGEYYVKRIIAVEGDTVEIRDGKVYVNDELLNEPYVHSETAEEDGAVRYPLSVGAGQIFIMGDNREVSMDSRSFGVVGKEQIKGKIWFHIGKFYIKKI